VFEFMLGVLTVLSFSWSETLAPNTVPGNVAMIAEILAAPAIEGL
jgi:hypothetical protein